MESAGFGDESLGNARGWAAKLVGVSGVPRQGRRLRGW